MINALWLIPAVVVGAVIGLVLNYLAVLREKNTTLLMRSLQAIHALIMLQKKYSLYLELP